jgi:hypothetical protein
VGISSSETGYRYEKGKVSPVDLPQPAVKVSRSRARLDRLLDRDIMQRLRDLQELDAKVRGADLKG